MNNDEIKIRIAWRGGAGFLLEENGISQKAKSDKNMLFAMLMKDPGAFMDRSLLEEIT